MERLSTNAKLALLINGPDNEEDAEDKLRMEREAKLKLRRATLYGSGARAKVPRVRRKKQEEKSPFTVMEPFEMPGQVALTSAVPPGAHYDQFRLVTNPTAFAKNDPDRTFYNSTSMKEGLVVVPEGSHHGILDIRTRLCLLIATLRRWQPHVMDFKVRNIFANDTQSLMSVLVTRGMNTPLIG